MKSLHKFWLLSWDDRILFLTAWVILSCLRLGLWLLPFRLLMRLLSIQPHHAIASPFNRKKYAAPVLSMLDKSDDCQVSVEIITWAVETASRYTPGGVKCLARALTTQLLMKRYGYVPTLQIGVAKGKDGKLEAHAWIEHQGKVAIGNLADLSRFVPLPSLEGVKL